MIPPVVTVAWWQKHHEETVTADVRWDPNGDDGYKTYLEGHLPGAIFVDLDTVLSGKPSAEEGRHPLPDPAVFASCMATLGISESDIVIAYDCTGGVIAARLVWMLRSIGFEAALLDGGLLSYPGLLEKGHNTLPQGRFTPHPWPKERLANIEDAVNATGAVIDARPRGRYLGDSDKFDPRSGHIPGASSLPCRENVDERGRFIPIDQLRRRFEGLGAVEGSHFISYCGSGVTACHNLLAFEWAGLGQGRLYPGSWSQYSRTNLPAELGDSAEIITTFDLGSEFDAASDCDAASDFDAGSEVKFK